MENIQQLLGQKELALTFQKMRLGLEKESQRTNLKGKLSQKDHPQSLGNRSYHPYIQTDFSETQVELITRVTDSPKEALDFLAALHDVALRSMPESEMLWPLSMPPALPEAEREIKIAKLERFSEVLYRRYLAKTYGKRKQMVSGIHYNFEFSPEFITALFKKQTKYQTEDELKTYIYMKVSVNYLRYRWLITYLYGASPMAEAGYFTDNHRPSEPVRSIRNSAYGYTNHKDVSVPYDSIGNYVKGIHELVEKGILSEEKEFYAPVRLRGGKKVADLADFGVNYIEVRNLDLNPFAPYGIEEKDIHFLQLFLQLMLWIDNEDLDANELVREGQLWNDKVALEHPITRTICLTEGKQLFAEMEKMLRALHAPTADLTLVQEKAEILERPEDTISGRIVEIFQTGVSNQELAVRLGLKNQQAAWAKPYQLAGFTDMELSTQILLFDAIQKGISVEVLDRQDQFLQLAFGKHVEYVKNANMTSLDNYIVPLMMENKTVTKKVLHKAHFPVPAGREYTTVEAALRDFPYFEKQAIVVKPKSTNYGLGISIFKESFNEKDYRQAVEIAFSEDSEILVEEFITGTEYRFFVLNGRTEAIMLRVPANVTGDGKQTISQLVAEKNQDALRGSHHRSPLELIKLGEIEKLMLKGQGYTVASIPARGEIVSLRENSNISTGGDSIDMTNEVHESYKKLAEDAVAALGACICGIDLIIPNKNQAASLENRNFGIIEANFNPAMHMHVYPYQGKSRRLTKKVLQLLFPEAYEKKDF